METTKVDLNIILQVEDLNLQSPKAIIANKYPLPDIKN
jgi:hypothetical protein